MPVSPSRTPRGPRARDADREAAATVLGAAYAEGQIDLDEHGRRVGQVWAATTTGQLDALLSDLQPAKGAPWPARPVRPKVRVANPKAAGALVAVLALAVAAPFLVGSDEGADEAVVVPSPSAVEAPSAFAEPDRIVDPRTPEGYEAFVAELEKEFDDTFVISADLNETSVYVRRMTQRKKLRWTTWYWDGEWTEWSVGTYSEDDGVWAVRAKGVDPSTFERAVAKVRDRVDDPHEPSIRLQHDPEVERSCYEVTVNNKWGDHAAGQFGCGGRLLGSS